MVPKVTKLNTQPQRRAEIDLGAVATSQLVTRLLNQLSEEADVYLVLK